MSVLAEGGRPSGDVGKGVLPFDNQISKWREGERKENGTSGSVSSAQTLETANSTPGFDMFSEQSSDEELN